MPVPGTSQPAVTPGPAAAGPLFAIGDSSVGHLGDGQTATDFSSPIQIGSLFWRMIACGGANTTNSDGHTVAIRSDGLLFTWGDNSSGQLGNGNTGTDQSSPVQIGSSSWMMCAAGSATSYAIDINGRLFTWGEGSNGETGQGVTADSNSPIQVGASSWYSVTAGLANGYAIRIDGLLFAWGSNTAGQIGDGAVVGTTRTSPVQIGAQTWSVVASHSLVSTVAAIRSDGLLFTWGFCGGSGLLGDGTNNGGVSLVNSKSSPVQIGSSSWKAISMANGGCMAIRVDNLLFTWGIGASGEIGDSTVVPKSSPVQIGSSQWRYVGGHASRHAIDIEGRLFGWGGSNSGQLGQGNTTGASSPVQVGSSKWLMIAGGTNITFTSFFCIGIKEP